MERTRGRPESGLNSKGGGQGCTRGWVCRFATTRRKKRYRRVTTSPKKRPKGHRIRYTADKNLISRTQSGVSNPRTLKKKITPTTKPIYHTQRHHRNPDNDEQMVQGGKRPRGVGGGVGGGWGGTRGRLRTKGSPERNGP